MPERCSTNLSLCCFCQRETDEKLKEPHANPHHHKAYQTLEEDIQFYIDNGIEVPYLPGKDCL